jgi:hypothetical protein
VNALLQALHAPNPRPSTAGTPSVKDAFRTHLHSLSQAPSQNPHIPALYSIMKTFWLPASPPYFASAAPAVPSTRTPSEHRFLYWDPMPLVSSGIVCQYCAAQLQNLGRITSGPIKVYDIEKPFFVIGCEYACSNPQCGRGFASVDASVLRVLPPKLRSEFPVKLAVDDVGVGQVWDWRAMGVSLSLWKLVKGALKAQVNRHSLVQAIRAVQDGVYEQTSDEEDAGIGLRPSSVSSFLPMIADLMLARNQQAGLVTGKLCWKIRRLRANIPGWTASREVKGDLRLPQSTKDWPVV